jgi:Co/Zn/Cd efflux system component
MKLGARKKRTRRRKHADQGYWRLIVLGGLGIGVFLLVLIFILAPGLTAVCRLISEFIQIVCRAIGQV